jgi:hypothetical protein
MKERMSRQFGNLQYRSAVEALVMIQSWTFFGLLESAFNTPFEAEISSFVPLMDDES